MRTGVIVTQSGHQLLLDVRGAHACPQPLRAACGVRDVWGPGPHGLSAAGPAVTSSQAERTGGVDKAGGAAATARACAAPRLAGAAGPLSPTPGRRASGQRPAGCVGEQVGHPRGVRPRAGAIATATGRRSVDSSDHCVHEPGASQRLGARTRGLGCSGRCWGRPSEGVRCCRQPVLGGARRGVHVLRRQTLRCFVTSSPRSRDQQ